MYYNKKNFDNHSESDRKNSWYWNVLLKKYNGSWAKAEKEVWESRKRCDMTLRDFWKYG